MLDGLVFRFMDMDPCPGKICQSAGMVDVEMGLDDVFDILRLVTQPCDLLDRGFLRVSRHPHPAQKKAHFSGGSTVIPGAKACVYQDQIPPCLNQKAVDNRFHIHDEGFECSAVQVMYSDDFISLDDFCS